MDVISPIGTLLIGFFGSFFALYKWNQLLKREERLERQGELKEFREYMKTDLKESREYMTAGLRESREQVERYCDSVRKEMHAFHGTVRDIHGRVSTLEAGHKDPDNKKGCF